ncbi:MAG: hypothetical protein AB4290_31360, partial [Spirulina sp.]
MSDINPSSEGTISIELGAEPSPEELQTAAYYTQRGLNVTFLKPLPDRRTPDLRVEGMGNIDLYHPEPTTQIEAVLRAIKKKEIKPRLF